MFSTNSNAKSGVLKSKVSIVPPKSISCKKTAKYYYFAVFLRSKPLKMVEAAGKRVGNS